MPSVSMIITAYNEEKTIEKKLKNCLEINYPRDKIEFIIGSDGSTDQTETIVRYYQKEGFKLYAFAERQGKANVLNKIVPEAKGDILVFSDANTLYDKDTIKHMVVHFIDSRVGGVCGNLILINPNENAGGMGEKLYWKYENHLKYLEGKIKTVFGASGGVYAIRRHLFFGLPFSKTTISDDFLIPMFIVGKGYDIIYESKAIAKELTSIDMKGEYQRKVRIGAANYYALHKIRCFLNPLRGYVALGLWSHKVIRWLVPFFLWFLFVSNLFLIKTELYFVFFLLQMLFYFCALLGWLLIRISVRIKILLYINYFVVVNFALFVGLIKYVRGTQKSAYTPLQR